MLTTPFLMKGPTQLGRSKGRLDKMAVHESMGEICPNEEAQLTYMECLQLYRMASNVINNKKLAVLFNVCGPLTYKLIKNLTTSKSRSDLSFVQL